VVDYYLGAESGIDHLILLPGTLGVDCPVTFADSDMSNPDLDRQALQAARRRLSGQGELTPRFAGTRPALCQSNNTKTSNNTINRSRPPAGWWSSKRTGNETVLHSSRAGHAGGGCAP
jgi:hypothetical protein